MTRAVLVFLVALPAAALAQREARPVNAPDQLIAPSPCVDLARKMCIVPTGPALACDVCNPIVPGQPMSPELVTEAPYDPVHHPTPLERTLKAKQKDLATRPVAPKL
jgi:hypothetical protein